MSDFKKDRAITFLVDKDTTLEDVLRRGDNAKLLSGNEVFIEAVNEMHSRITLEEDQLIREADSDDRLLNQKIRNKAMMRCLLTDFVVTLNGFISEAEMMHDQVNK